MSVNTHSSTPPLSRVSLNAIFFAYSRSVARLAHTPLHYLRLKRRSHSLTPLEFHQINYTVASLLQHTSLTHIRKFIRVNSIPKIFLLHSIVVATARRHAQRDSRERRVAHQEGRGVTRRNERFENDHDQI